jgi:N-acetyl sugar amidotransferase
MEISFCTKCLTPNSWPDAIFDAQGVCMPCRYAETWPDIDWNARRKELLEIAEWGRRTKKGTYDCIIGVSGGKDSTRQAFFARDELGLTPLLVSCVYPPEQQTQRGADNLSNLVEAGFDLHIVGPAPKISKHLTRYSFLTYGNIFKATELTLYSSLPKVAIAYNIPLIFLGENPALNFGGSVGSLTGDGNKQRHHNTLGGAKIEPWLESGVTAKEMFWYRYPSDRDMERAQLRIVYLGYYMPDFNDTANGAFALGVGLKPREGIDALPEETGSLNAFEALDDEFVHVNQMLKMLKLGFGKVTQQASVKIRLGEIDREEGIRLVRRYDGKCSDRYIEKFCGYIGISREEFDAVADTLRNPNLWQKNNRGDWELRYQLPLHEDAL